MSILIPIPRRDNYWPRMESPLQRTALVDVKQQDNSYELYMDVPGVDHEAITLDLHDRLLSVSCSTEVGALALPGKALEVGDMRRSHSHWTHVQNME